MASDQSTAPGAAGGGRARWGVLGLVLGVLVASLAVFTWVVLDRGAGSGPGERLESLRDPAADPVTERETVLAAGRTFVQRFNTYGPDLLDQSGKMPEYAAVGDLMTAKFGKVFESNVGYAEETVNQTGIDRVAQVYAVGVSAIDDDSAELLVGGVVEFTYPDPEKPTERVPFEPLRFRYEVSLVKVDGQWLVDDLDDVDDGLPSFGEASDPQPGTPGGTPSGAPTDQPSATPSGEPSGSATPGGAASDATSGGADQ